MWVHTNVSFVWPSLCALIKDNICHPPSNSKIAKMFYTDIKLFSIAQCKVWRSFGLCSKNIRVPQLYAYFWSKIISLPRGFTKFFLVTKENAALIALKEVLETRFSVFLFHRKPNLDQWNAQNKWQFLPGKIDSFTWIYRAKLGAVKICFMKVQSLHNKK